MYSSRMLNSEDKEIDETETLKTELAQLSNQF